MNHSEILIYQDRQGKIKIDVRLEDKTVWLTQEHMAQLFGKSKKTISEHICNMINSTRWPGWFWLMASWSISAVRRWSFRKKPSGSV
jgi:hypothetical protein